jgi:large subunit ribosomal protein L6
MKSLKKKYSIKVPKNIKVIYCDEKNLITFIGPLMTKSLKVSVKLLLLSSANLIIVSPIPITGKKSAISLKNVSKIQGTTIAKIKQILIEITYTLYHKLNLVGVGYRVFSHETLANQLYFKLGYSHLIYFNLPTNIQTYNQKFTKLFLFGTCSNDSLTQTAAQIRNCKLPEPYKGKGILYDQEQITLKKGKKI